MEENKDALETMCKVFKYLNPKTKIIIQSEYKNDIYDITHKLMHTITFNQLKNKVPSLDEDTKISKYLTSIMTADILKVLDIYRQKNPKTNTIEVCVGKDNQINLEASKTILKKCKEVFPHGLFLSLDVDSDFITTSYIPVLHNLKNKKYKNE